MKQGVVYNVRYTTCLETRRKTNYSGECARTCYDQGVDHLDDLREGIEGHPLAEQQHYEHPDGQDNFQMKIEFFSKSALARQTKEGDLIANYQGDNLLNK